MQVKRAAQSRSGRNGQPSHRGAFAVVFVLMISLYSLTIRSHAAQGATPAQAAVNWRLGSQDYPAGTKITRAGLASSASMNRLFGSLHDSAYDTLGRVDNRGWAQVGSLTRTTTQHHVRTKHVLTWIYGVSYYPNETQASEAEADVNKGLSPLPGIAPHAGMARFKRGSDTSTFVLLGTAGVVVEMLCTARTKEGAQYRRMLSRYCTRQRDALGGLLRQATSVPATLAPSAATNTAIPTPVPTTPPTAIPTAPPTSVPTSIPTNTPVPTATQGPAMNPTPFTFPTNTPTATPQPPTNTPVVMPPPTNTPVVHPTATMPPQPTATKVPTPTPTSTPSTINCPLSVHLMSEPGAPALQECPTATPKPATATPKPTPKPATATPKPATPKPVTQ